jgi:hypothetical protein
LTVPLGHFSCKWYNSNIGIDTVLLVSGMLALLEFRDLDSLSRCLRDCDCLLLVDADVWWVCDVMAAKVAEVLEEAVVFCYKGDGFVDVV